MDTPLILLSFSNGALPTLGELIHRDPEGNGEAFEIGILFFGIIFIQVINRAEIEAILQLQRSLDIECVREFAALAKLSRNVSRLCLFQIGEILGHILMVSFPDLTDAMGGWI